MTASPFGDIRMRGFSERVEVGQFQEIVREHTEPLDDEILPLAEVAGRVLSDPITSTVDVPAFARSAMDGYALRGEETFGASAYNPLQFRVVGEVTPGKGHQGTVATGEAVRIMTGAPLPDGCDAVLMAEYTTESDGVMHTQEAVPPGRHVGKVGEDIRQGFQLFRPGRVLRPQDLGVLASIGHAKVRVRRRPTVTLIITGDELVKPGESAKGSKIVDSNSVMLKSLVERDGGVVREVHHLEDNRETIRRAILDLPGEIVVTTGGTSVGVEDHAPTLIAEEGTLLVHGVAMRPSAPTGFGIVADRPVFLLPGNPVSCLAAYDFFVALAVRRLAGRTEQWPYPLRQYPLRNRISSQIGRVDYARVRIEQGKAEFLAASGASILSSTSLADGFVVVDQDSEGLADGAMADVWLYDLENPL